MRIRLHPSVAKLVNKHRKTLTSADEVNRALSEYYAPKPQPVTIDNEALMKVLGSHNVRRFLRHE